MTWTREHDRIIAEKCEGWSRIAGHPHVMRAADGHGIYIPHYSTDLVAVVRAAEAWRKGDENIDRTVTIHSAIERLDIPFVVELRENYRVDDKYEWRTYTGDSKACYAAALAHALYQAVTP